MNFLGSEAPKRPQQFIFLGQDCQHVANFSKWLACHTHSALIWAIWVSSFQRISFHLKACFRRWSCWLRQPPDAAAWGDLWLGKLLLAQVAQAHVNLVVSCYWEIHDERTSSRFNVSSSNLNNKMDDGASCNSARVTSRTAGSETLRSRFGGDWSPTNQYMNRENKKWCHTKNEFDGFYILSKTRPHKGIDSSYLIRGRKYFFELGLICESNTNSCLNYSC